MYKFHVFFIIRYFLIIQIYYSAGYQPYTCFGEVIKPGLDSGLDWTGLRITFSVDIEGIIIIYGVDQLQILKRCA